MDPRLCCLLLFLLAETALGWMARHRHNRHQPTLLAPFRPLCSLKATSAPSPPQKDKNIADAIVSIQDWDSDAYGEDDAEDVDFLKFLEDEFDSISTNGLLSFDQFIEWEECQDILADEFLTLKDFLRIWNKVVGSHTKACDFSTFLTVNEEIDAAV